MPQSSAAESIPRSPLPPSSRTSIETLPPENAVRNVRDGKEQSAVSMVETGNHSLQLRSHGGGTRAIVVSTSRATSTTTKETGFGAMLRKASRKLGLGGNGGLREQGSTTAGCNREGDRSTTCALPDARSDEEIEQRRGFRLGSSSREGGATELITPGKGAKTSTTRHSLENDAAALSSSERARRGSRTQSISGGCPETEVLATTHMTSRKSDADRKASTASTSNSFNFNLSDIANPLRKLRKMMKLKRTSVSVALPEWEAHQELSRRMNYFPRKYNRPFAESYVLGDVLGAGGFAEVKSGKRKIAP